MTGTRNRAARLLAAVAVCAAAILTSYASDLVCAAIWLVLLLVTLAIWGWMKLSATPPTKATVWATWATIWWLFAAAIGHGQVIPALWLTPLATMSLALLVRWYVHRPATTGQAVAS